MDLSCVFFVTKYGDVIISKDYSFDGVLGKVAPEFRLRVINEINDDGEEDDDEDDDEDEEEREEEDDDEDDDRRLPDEQPCFTHDGAVVYFISRDDIYVVASTPLLPASRRRLPSSTPAIVALDFLTRLYDLICTLCRLSPPDSLDAKRLLLHQIIVLEILDEIVAKGQLQVASADKIKNLIYSPLPPPPSASSAVEISTTTASTSIQKLASFLPAASSLLATPHFTPHLASPLFGGRFDPGIFNTAYSVIPSALRNAVSTLAATARQASSDGDVFVDVVERVSLKVDAGGKVELFRLQGQVIIEARFKRAGAGGGGGGGGGGGASVPKIKLFLPEDTIVETKHIQHWASSHSSGPRSAETEDRPSEAADAAAAAAATSGNATFSGGRGFTGSATVLTNCVFHPFCSVDDRVGENESEAKKPEMIASVANGEKILALSYQVSRESMKQPPPLHVDTSVGRPVIWKTSFFSATVSIVLTSRMPPRSTAASIKVTLPIPDYILEAARLTSNLPYIQGVEESMEFDRKNSRLVWSIRHLPGKSCVDLETRLTWQKPKNTLQVASSSNSNVREDEGYDDRRPAAPSSSISFTPPRLPLPSMISSTSSSSSSSSSSSCSAVAPSNSLDVGPAFLEFELSGFSQSGFRIEALKFVDSASASTTAAVQKETQNVNRWLRYITLDGNVYSLAAR